MMKRSAYRFVTVLLATLVMIVPLAACHTETQETEAESEMVYERPPKTTADPAAETATPVPGETGNPAEPSQAVP